MTNLSCFTITLAITVQDDAIAVSVIIPFAKKMYPAFKVNTDISGRITILILPIVKACPSSTKLLVGSFGSCWANAKLDTSHSDSDGIDSIPAIPDAQNVPLLLCHERFN